MKNEHTFSCNIRSCMVNVARLWSQRVETVLNLQAQSSKCWARPCIHEHPNWFQRWHIVCVRLFHLLVAYENEVSNWEFGLVKKCVDFTSPQHLTTCNRSSTKCAHERVYHKHGDTQSNQRNIEHKHLLAEPQPNRVHFSYSKSCYQDTMQPQSCIYWQQAFQANQHQWTVGTLSSSEQDKSRSAGARSASVIQTVFPN